MKHKKSKWFRIAVEGATTDGREIQRAWIQDMADQYDQNTYGARINCEHLKSFMPAGDFGAYGDVVALKAEEVEIDGKTKLALFAQIKPNDNLLELNKKGQKIYTSIEVQPDFADTGKAYLVGLAITDSPASLGTEALNFSAKHGTLANRKAAEGNLFTAAELTEIEFEEEKESALAELKSKVAALFGRVQTMQKENAQHEYSEALSQLVAVFNQQLDNQEKAREQVACLSEQVAALQSQLEQLQSAFNNYDPQPSRPPMSGGSGQVLADF